jgi:hypothetical protein
VFRATSYFTGRADDRDTVVAPDQLATHDTRMIAESFRAHDDEKLGGVHELELAKSKPAGKSNGFMLSYHLRDGSQLPQKDAAVANN